MLTQTEEFGTAQIAAVAWAFASLSYWDGEVVAVLAERVVRDLGGSRAKAKL